MSEGKGHGVGGKVSEKRKVLARPLPLGFVAKALDEDLQRSRLSRDLIFYIIFLISFVYFFYARRDVEGEFMVAQTMRELILDEELPPTNPIPGSDPNEMPYFFKNYNEIGNYPDWYDYVEAVLVRQLFADPPENSELTRRVAGQLLPLGALRIRAKHVHNRSCSANSHFYPGDPNWEHVCYDHYNWWDEKTDPIVSDGYIWNYSDTGCAEANLQQIFAEVATYDCGGYVVDIPFTTSKSTALAEISKLRLGKFANVLSVRVLIVELVVYSPPTDTFLNIKLVVEVTAGGAFIPQQRFKPFKVYTRDDGVIIYTVYFLVFVLYYWFSFVLDWHTSYRNTKKLFSFLLSMWNLLQLANLICFTVMFVMYFIWWGKSTEQAWTLPYASTGYPMTLTSISELYTMIIYVNAFNTVICFLMIMKYLRLNNRLNILSRTLESTAQSILGVLIIFCLIVTGYACAGHVLYGNGIMEYRSVSEAFAALFRLLIGSFDYPAMRDESRSLTFIFFWSFVILGLFVLLNFVVAVVMLGFDDEVRKIKNLPLFLVIKMSLRNLKNFITAPGLSSRIKMIVISRTKKLPQQVLNDYVQGHITTTTMSRRSQISENADDIEEDQVEEDVYNMTFYRHDFDRIIPPEELENVGSAYIDAAWIDLQGEYETSNVDEDAKRDDEICRSVFEACIEGCTELLMAYHAMLFGVEETPEEEEEVKGGEEGQKKKKTKKPKKNPELMASVASARLLGAHLKKKLASSGAAPYGADHDQGDQASSLRREGIRTGTGTYATTTTEFVTDLERRLGAVERQMSSMSELTAMISRKSEATN